MHYTKDRDGMRHPDKKDIVKGLLFEIGKSNVRRVGLLDTSTLIATRTLLARCPRLVVTVVEHSAVQHALQTKRLAGMSMSVRRRVRLIHSELVDALTTLEDMHYWWDYESSSFEPSVLKWCAKSAFYGVLQFTARGKKTETVAKRFLRYRKAVPSISSINGYRRDKGTTMIVIEVFGRHKRVPNSRVVYGIRKARLVPNGNRKTGWDQLELLWWGYPSSSTRLDIHPDRPISVLSDTHLRVFIDKQWKVLPYDSSTQWPVHCISRKRCPKGMVRVWKYQVKPTLELERNFRHVQPKGPIRDQHGQASDRHHRADAADAAGKD